MASRARLEGNCNYSLWTTEELIEAYNFEKKRISKSDREATQREIKKELRRRFNVTIKLLDEEPDAKATYRYLLNE